MDVDGQDERWALLTEGVVMMDRAADALMDVVNWIGRAVTLLEKEAQL